MSDVVEWLRDRAFRKSGPTMEAVHTKQKEWIWADDIERLRAENEKLREETRSKGERIGGYVNMLVKREAEIEKLRAALKPFADIGITEARKVGLWSPKSVITMYVNYENISAAAAALKETGDE